ncbi:MAG: dihydroxyacetone kinase subunit DhaK [Acetobacteraceae bacterium]|nr:dihydroxyacetone kinase subunit DhaK [Acetobacteraceae bacterium]
MKYDKAVGCWRRQPDQIVEAAQAVAGEPGVLLIVKNHAGDCMNFEMATEIAEFGIMAPLGIRRFPS